MKAGTIRAGAWKSWARTRFLSLAVIFSFGFGAQAALAHTETGSHHHYPHFAARHRYLAANHHHHYYYADARRHERLRYAHYGRSAHYRYSWLQCVPYAREVSHIELSGDAFLWWAEASGRYARGATPVEGAVLNFRSIRRMPLGHVAVVTAVLDNRTILVTQANWVRGAITNDVTMQDVSPNNDWSEVQVELGDSSRWGAAYPTYGFIYNQPADSTIIAAATPPDEVAEAPRPAPLSTDAPDRNLQ